MIPIAMTHGATTFKFLYFCKSIIGPFNVSCAPACVDSFLDCVAVLVDHRCHIPVLRGANFGDPEIT